MAQGKFSVTYRDFSDEASSVTFNIPVVASANFDGVEADCLALRVAMDALQLGITQGYTISKAQRLSNLPATNGAANREAKWLVTYEDNSLLTQSTHEIPCADVEDETLRLANTDIWDPANAEWVAFKTAFEAVALSPAGNPVTMVKAVLVGRNV